MPPKIQRSYHVSTTDQQVDKPSVSEPVKFFFVKLSPNMGYSKKACWARLAKKGRPEQKSSIENRWITQEVTNY